VLFSFKQLILISLVTSYKDVTHTIACNKTFKQSKLFNDMEQIFEATERAPCPYLVSKVLHFEVLHIDSTPFFLFCRAGLAVVGFLQFRRIWKRQNEERRDTTSEASPITVTLYKVLPLATVSRVAGKLSQASQKL